jgi:peptide/nickel transport system permease protein
MSRVRYVAFRTVQTVLILWIILTALWILFRSMPGSFADIMIYQGANPETVETFRENWGLNDPLYIQYLRYIENFVMLDPGTSIVSRRPVWDLVNERIFNTFILVAPAITFAYILGSAIGVVFGSKRGSKLEEYGIIPLTMSGAIPDFFIAILLIVVFGQWIDLFPVSGMMTTDTLSRFSEAPWWRPYFTTDFLSHYVLPFTAIVLRYLYYPVLIMRTSVVEVLGQEFNFYHRITGLPKRKLLTHLGKHASLPVITVYPISMARALSGIVLIEVVFNWPGIGNALVQAVLARDFPVVQFVFFLVAAWVVLANYAIDLLYGIIDPRVSVGE